MKVYSSRKSIALQDIHSLATWKLQRLEGRLQGGFFRLQNVELCKCSCKGSWVTAGA